MFYVILRMRISLWWAISLPLAMYINASTILGLFPLPRPTHFIMFEKLMRGLTDRGHQVDVVSHFPQKRPISRYRDINLRNNNDPIEKHNLSVSVVENFSVFETADFLFRQCGTDMCDKLIKHPAIKELLKTKKKYDLIITEVYGSDCMLGFAHMFKVPVVGVLTDVMVPWASDRMGNPDNPSYIPNYLLPFGSKMTLRDRVLNTFSGLAYKLGYQALSVIPSELRARELFGPNLTPIDNLAYNMSLLLVNSHFSIHFPRPMVPAVVEVAGLHIETPKSLPVALDNLTKASKPIIYVMLNTEYMPKNDIRIIIDALIDLATPVLWNGNINDIPRNIPDDFFVNNNKLNKLDVLCHPQTGFFLTNGDLFSIQEAIHCGVPIIGIPLIAEHEIYVRDFKNKGIAIHIPLQNITKDIIFNAANTILKDLTFRSNAKIYSNWFRDRPMKPLDTALYWIEYVMRHGGAKHLRTVGADLIWMEYYMIDVGLVYILGFLLVLGIILLIRNVIDQISKRSVFSESIKKQK